MVLSLGSRIQRGVLRIKVCKQCKGSIIFALNAIQRCHSDKVYVYFFLSFFLESGAPGGLVESCSIASYSAHATTSLSFFLNTYSRFTSSDQ